VAHESSPPRAKGCKIQNAPKTADCGGVRVGEKVGAKVGVLVVGEDVVGALVVGFEVVGVEVVGI